ncbi:MAG: hypothetical protein RL477_1378, partial [Pseudomonadota bacterium]
MVDPAGAVVPDVAEQLPGRGMWVTAERAVLARAVEKNFFGRAAQRTVEVPVELPLITERAVEKRALELLGLLRRTNAVVAGFDKVEAALAAGQVAVVLTAADASANAHAKGAGFAKALPHITWLGVAEMSLAL